MIRIALRMLMGDRGKYAGMVLGLTFASFLITQQAAIFVGLMTFTHGFITDAGLADVWVMDPKVQFPDDIKPLQDTQLHRVRGVEGVEWGVPLYRGFIRTRLDSGGFQTCIVVGLDDATLIGGPAVMLEGSLADLRRSEGVIVDVAAARDKLARILPDGTKVPLRVGDTLELNDHRGVVVGICRASRTLMAYPLLYTTYTRGTTFAPQERKLLSFVLVKARPGVPIPELCRRIKAATGLAAHTRPEFEDMTIAYFMKNTGIPINFGIAVLLGFLVGTAIAGQTFYSFTLENLRYFGALKAMGATNFTLLRMVVVQALLVGGIGYGLGVGLAALFGRAIRNTELAFRFPWPLLGISFAAVLVICVVAAVLSLRKVLRLEPAVVFKS